MGLCSLFIQLSAILAEMCLKIDVVSEIIVYRPICCIMLDAYELFENRFIMILDPQNMGLDILFFQ